jgi:uncharacterized membrane protein
MEKWTDQRVEDIVADLLRIGVLLAAAVVVCGAVIYLARHGHQAADYRMFRGESSSGCCC